jgi:hypothetical protein
VLPAFTEKEIFYQSSGREQQDNDHQQPEQAHADIIPPLI